MRGDRSRGVLTPYDGADGDLRAIGLKVIEGMTDQGLPAAAKLLPPPSGRPVHRREPPVHLIDPEHRGPGALTSPYGERGLPRGWHAVAAVGAARTAIPSARWCPPRPDGGAAGSWWATARVCHIKRNLGLLEKAVEAGTAPQVGEPKADDCSPFHHPAQIVGRFPLCQSRPSQAYWMIH